MMARPWIEFVQSQRLGWARDVNVRPGVEVKTLSRDREGGAASLILRYPAGWRRTGPEHLHADEEFLVLDGALELNGRRYGDKAYAHLPAGYTRHDTASPEGATVLTFFSARPQTFAGDGAGCDEARLVEHLDAMHVPYTGNFHAEFPPGAGRKMLYEDPETGDQSWILGTLPMRWAERAETHPVVEEMYLLAGEVHGNRGVMRPGAYFWRPPGEPHGPYGSLTGNLYFFRTKGGKLATEYRDPEQPFHWWPAYDPVLPEEMRAAAGEAPCAPRCF